MSSIFAPILPSGVVRDQWSTLYVGKSRKRGVDYRSIITIYSLPLMFGICAGIWGNTLLDNAPALLVAVAVYTGAILNLSLSVFDRSLAMRNVPFREGDEVTLDLADQLFANTSYTVMVGLITTAILAGDLLFFASADIFWVSRVIVGIVASLLAHLFVMSGLIMKRFRSLREALKP